MRKSNKKKVLKQKDGERNFHFSSCTTDVQAALRETRRADWNKWTKFNAGIVLTDEEVRQLTEAGCEIYPMKWVDTDKNAYPRRDHDYVSVPAKYKSRLVGCGNFETTDSEQILQLVTWIRTISFVVGAHRPTSPFILATFTNGYQGQEIDRIFLYRIPAEGIPEDGIAGGEILPSRVPVHGTKDAGLGL